MLLDVMMRVVENWGANHGLTFRNPDGTPMFASFEEAFRKTHRGDCIYWAAWVVAYEPAVDLVSAMLAVVASAVHETTAGGVRDRLEQSLREAAEAIHTQDAERRRLLRQSLIDALPTSQEESYGNEQTSPQEWVHRALQLTLRYLDSGAQGVFEHGEGVETIRSTALAVTKLGPAYVSPWPEDNTAALVRCFITWSAFAEAVERCDEEAFVARGLPA